MQDLKIKNQEALYEEAQRRAANFDGMVDSLLQNVVPDTFSFAKLSDR